MSPQIRLRARFCPGVTFSTFTFFQSHSSSSATSWTRPVIVPCPISERATRMTHVSSGLTRTQALTSVPSLALWERAESKPDGKLNPSASPPPAAAEPTMNVRRESLALSWIVFFTAGLPRLGSGCVIRRHVHGSSDALIGSTSTDVGHGFVDVFVRRLRSPLEQCRGSHDLSRLAIAALGHVNRCPSLLHWMRARGREALDGDDPVARFHVSDANGAGALHLIIDVYGAGAALSDAAAIFRAGKANLLADHPQERRFWLHLYVPDTAIDIELRHELPLASCLRRECCCCFVGGQESGRELKCLSDYYEA